MNCNQLATPDKNPQATLQNNPFDVVRKTLEDPAVLKAIRKSARTGVGARKLPTIQVGTKSLQQAAPVQQADALAIYRQQVRQEQGEKIVRSKMSDAALAKLRAIKEQEKADAITGERFATALKYVIVNQENLQKLIARCNSSIPVIQLERRAQKLLWWISAGFLLGREIDTICLINFFSELTADEAVMSEGNFSGVWNASHAAKVKASRVNRGVIASEGPVYRPCRSGKKCLKFEKRRPAPANGSGAYCTVNCAAGDRARVKRALSASGSSSFLN